MAFESPHTPRRVIRFLQLEDHESACRSSFAWLCAACRACTVRCPRGVDVAGVMEYVRREAGRLGCAAPGADAFYRDFLGVIEKEGRAREFRLGVKSVLRRLPLHPLEDALLFLRLWRRGKLP